MESPSVRAIIQSEILFKVYRERSIHCTIVDRDENLVGHISWIWLKLIRSLDDERSQDTAEERHLDGYGKINGEADESLTTYNNEDGINNRRPLDHQAIVHDFCHVEVFLPELIIFL